jgi:flagellar biosynthesis regulator FlbT
MGYFKNDYFTKTAKYIDKLVLNNRYFKIICEAEGCMPDCHR